VFEEFFLFPQQCGLAAPGCQMPSPAARADGGVSLGQYGGITWQIVSSAAASRYDARRPVAVDRQKRAKIKIATA